MDRQESNVAQRAAESIAATSTTFRSGLLQLRPRPELPFDDQITFARGFLSHPREVGSVIPSSKFLERRLVRAAGLAQARTVVELGPGTGGTTRAFLRALLPDAHLLAVELSHDFHRRLMYKLSDPRLVLQLGSAEHLDEWLKV